MSKPMSHPNIPDRIRLGEHHQSIILALIYYRKEAIEDGDDRPLLCGFGVPSWQRGLVWNDKQKVSLIESIWKGVPIGTYTYNISDENPDLDNILIDGQQRINAISGYLNNDFPVFDVFFDDLETPMQRRFGSGHFHSYRTNTEDVDYLKGYYNLMNFGGTNHNENEKA